MSDWWWAVLTAVTAAVLGAAAVRRLTGRRRSTGLEDVVADGLADAWSHRLGVPSDHIRPALTGRDGALRDRIGSLVQEVSCVFRRTSGAEDRHLVVVGLDCAYRNGGSEQVTMRVPWRRVPSGVRRELLGARPAQPVRTWRPTETTAK